MQRNKYFLTDLVGRQTPYYPNTIHTDRKMIEELIDRAAAPAHMCDQFYLGYAAEDLPQV